MLGLGMDPLTAMLRPRAHSQLLPDKVDLEDQGLPVLGNNPLRAISTPDQVYADLEARGHHNVTHWADSMGVAQLIVVDRDSGTRYAVSDPRKDGRPSAYS